MSEQDELKAKIESLHGKLNEFYALDSSWRKLGKWPKDVTGSVLHPAASEDEIAEAEKRFGHTFPPSYKAFLRLHSGWEHFWGDTTLIGTGRPATKKAQDKIAEYVEHQAGRLKERFGHTPTKSEVKAWEAEEDRYLCLANHLILGTDFSGAVWVYDTRTIGRDKEMKLVFWEISYGAQDPTFDRFDAFLDFAIGEVDFRLENLARKRGAKKAPAKAKTGGGAKPAKRKK